MAIAARLKWFLDVNRVHYEVLKGDPSGTGAPGRDQLVVSRLFHDARGYLMVVLPASREIGMPALEKRLGRPLHPARASELSDIFFDCPKGIVPPLGPAYGIPTVVDDSVPREGDVYFRADDSEDLVHISGAEFQGLLAGAEHAAPHDA